MGCSSANTQSPLPNLQMRALRFLSSGALWKDEKEGMKGNEAASWDGSGSGSESGSGSGPVKKVNIPR